MELLSLRFSMFADIVRLTNACIIIIINSENYTYPGLSPLPFSHGAQTDGW